MIVNLRHVLEDLADPSNWEWDGGGGWRWTPDGDTAREYAEGALARNRLCPCGNEARYRVTDGAAPTLCGVCDVVKNEGKGERV